MFNSLTGSTAHVGNWPGVTVDKREGVYKKLSVPVAIVDLPGIYSLSPYTPEEVISRNFILDEKPDCVINIIDATNLERNLYLTTQIMEIDVPMVVALNMIDVVKKSGDKLDAKKLEEKIGLPVVEISALKEEGIKELMERAYAAAQKKREGSTVLKDSPLSHVIDDVKIALKGKGVENPLFHAVKLTEGDELEVKAHPEEIAMVEEFKKQFADDVFAGDFEAMVADARYKYISANFSTALTRAEKEGDAHQIGQSGQSAHAQDLGYPHLCRHPVCGVPPHVRRRSAVSERDLRLCEGRFHGQRSAGCVRRRVLQFRRRFHAGRRSCLI